MREEGKAQKVCPLKRYAYLSRKRGSHGPYFRLKRALSSATKRKPTFDKGKTIDRKQKRKRATPSCVVAGNELAKKEKSA